MRTIVAPATPLVPSAIGVIRLAGPAAFAIGAKVFGRLPEPRVAALREAVDAAGSVIDHGLLLCFVGPRSYTGDDIVEFHGHGSPAAMAQIIAACTHWGAVLARPGEFTERAFRAGKLDLSQAEAVADLIHARSQRAARAAAQSLRGAFKQAVCALQTDITQCRVRVEANLDFPEEDGVDPRVVAEASHFLDTCCQRVEEMLAQTQRAIRTQEGLRLALLGPPNVGKSSLLNALVGDELAIVSELAGTTRDRVLGQLVIGGVPFEVVDTAGLRQTRDAVEAEGIARSKAAALEVDVVVWLGDASGRIPDERQMLADLMAQRSAAHASGGDAGLAPAAPRPSQGQEVLCVLNKADQASGKEPAGPWDLLVSAKTGQGLDALRDRLLQLGGLQGEASDAGAWSGRERHRLALVLCVQALREGQALLASGSLELAAESLRLAQGRLSEITGEFTSDDLLGEIFSSFCIGK